MPTYDLTEKLTSYGSFKITAQSTATGYEDSDVVGLTYSIGPKIALKKGIITITSLIQGVTSFDIYANETKIGNVAYDYSSDWSIAIEDYMASLDDGKYTVSLCAVGEGISDNRSNSVTVYKGGSPIYGVSWVNDTTTTMTRTDDATEMTYAIQSSDGSIASDFNDAFPWNETAILTLDAGQFLKFPDMYFRVGVDDNGDINSVAVSASPSSDGDWYEVKSFYYGIYGASMSGSALQSVTGVARKNNITRAAFRTAAQAAGDGYFQLDLYHKTVLTFLWWIEWATKNSESIMVGKTSATGSSAVNTGGTDNVSTPSGFNTSTKQMRYHYIEDFIGNYWEFIDGVSGNTSNKIWVCADPAKYTDTVGDSNYSQTSYTIQTSNGFPLGFGWDANNPFMVYGTRTGGSGSTAFCDYTWVMTSSYPVVYSGAAWDYSGSNCGLCYFGDSSVGAANGNLGARLLKRQLEKYHWSVTSSASWRKRTPNRVRSSRAFGSRKTVRGRKETSAMARCLRQSILF